MEDKTCRICIDNDDGLCDRIEILVEDEDSCEKWRGKDGIRTNDDAGA